MLKREVRLKSGAVPQLCIGAIRNNPLFFHVYEDGKDRKAMIMSQETCLFYLVHQFLRRIGGVGRKARCFLNKDAEAYFDLDHTHTNNQPSFMGGCFFVEKIMEVFKLYGTVNYYIEQLQTTIMNRLVTEESLSLEEGYTKLKNDIQKLDEVKVVKETYLANLNKAYEIVNERVAGSQEADSLEIQV